MTASQTSDENCCKSSSAADGSAAFKTFGKIPNRQRAKLRAPSFSNSSVVLNAVLFAEPLLLVLLMDVFVVLLDFFGESVLIDDFFGDDDDEDEAW